MNFRPEAQKETEKGPINIDGEYDRVDDIADESTSHRMSKKRRVAVYENKHICMYCGKKYFIFHIHVSDHPGPDGSRVHRCDCCPIYFQTAAERIAHTKTPHKDRLTCEFCNRSFINARALNGHRRVYHKG